MKRGLLLLFAAACGYAVWQQWRITDLREAETRAAAARVAARPALAGEDEPLSSFSETSSKEPIAEEELPAILATLRALESGFERAGVFDREIETFRVKRPELMQKLARLTPAQAVSLFGEWMGDENVPRSHHSHVVSRMALIMGQANPAAALEIAAERPNGIGVYHSKIFSNWFLNDPRAVLNWVKAWDARAQPEPADAYARDFANEASRWAALAHAIEDPAAGAREFARFAKETTITYYTGLQELGQKLESMEARLAFLQELHVATGGKVNIAAFVKGVAKRTSFAQVSYLLDQLPVFTPAVVSDGFPSTGKPGTLRYLAASASADRTPVERWEWLITRAEDIPEGTALEDLVNNWANEDDAATAEWMATLAPGPTRTAAEKAFTKWRQTNSR